MMVTLKSKKRKTVADTQKGLSKYCCFICYLIGKKYNLGFIGISLINVVEHFCYLFTSCGLLTIDIYINIYIFFF